MTYQEVLSQGSLYLQQQEVPEAALDAWYLLQEAVARERGQRIDRAWYYLHHQDTMPAHTYNDYQKLLCQRGKRIPLQHIIGEQEFMGLRFLVNQDVLIPRQDTEILVEEAMKLLRPGMSVLDMCTGSGCIIISLLKLVPGITGQAADISAGALQVARENAASLAVPADFHQSDLFTAIAGRFDMIVSNPPYIPTANISSLMAEVRCFEPTAALDGKEDGLYFYRELAKTSPDYLKPGGWLLLETGCEQSKDVSGLLRDAGFTDIKVVKDLAGLDRVTIGRKI